jgi:small-conductance mechanosensitive channel
VTATAAVPETGWLYDLLTKAGLDPSTAHTVVQFVVRPISILIVVAVAWLLSHFGAKSIKQGLGRVAGRGATRLGSERTNARAATMVGLLSGLWRGLVVVVAFAIILGIFGINLTPLLASATIIGATLGFGFQSLIRDYLSGVLLTFEDQFAVGDTISVNEATGVVEDLSLRVTRLRAMDGTLWYVPNGDIRRVSNASRGWAKAVVDVPVSLPAVADLSSVKDLLAATAREVAGTPQFAPGTLNQPPEVLGVIAAEPGIATVRVVQRTVPAQRDALERALREAVVAQLVAQGFWPPPAAEPAGPAPAGPNPPGPAT